MVRLFFLLLPMILFFPGCLSNPNLIDNLDYEEIPFRIQILNYGVYGAKIESTVNANDTLLGNVLVSGDFNLLKKTENIQGTLDLSFGIEYILLSKNKKQEGQLVKLRTKVIHPAITNPETLEKNTVDEWNEARLIGDAKHTSFRFQYNWEIVEGKWEIQLWFKDHLLASKGFYVTR